VAKRYDITPNGYHYDQGVVTYTRMSRGLGKIEALLLREIAITLGDFVPDDQDKSRSHKCILLNSLDLAKLLMPPRAVGEPVRPIPTATRKQLSNVRPIRLSAVR
jgi:hypothetical protein